MSPLRLEVITADRVTYSNDVDVVVAPGVEGELGILPHHAPLMTMLQPGELRIRKGKEEEYLVVSGGFLEVRPDKVVVLADTAERAEEIDLSRAEAAKERARQRIESHLPGTDMLRAEVALRRALARVQVAQRRRRRERPT